jgi:hypothetical protein
MKILTKGKLEPDGIANEQAVMSANWRRGTHGGSGIWQELGLNRKVAERRCRQPTNPALSTTACIDTSGNDGEEFGVDQRGSCCSLPLCAVVVIICGTGGGGMRVF